MATALEATRVPGRETNARWAVRPRALRRAKAGETRAGAARAAAVAIAGLTRTGFSAGAFFIFFPSLRKFWLLFAVWQQSVTSMTRRFSRSRPRSGSPPDALTLAAKSPAEIRPKKNLSEIFFRMRI
jgi:hypothetical protein